MRILELANFSAGVCGVWTRVKEEAFLLSKKHEVLVCSSNAVKGSNQTAPAEETIGNLKIRRFPYTKLGGEGFLSWNFEQAALDFKPDIIIAHVYRHLHTTKSLKLAKQLNAKVFLVTHAPFVEGDTTRSLFAKQAVRFYDTFFGPRIINKFDSVIAITHWETPYLLKLGCKEEKIVYIPNGIPEVFFKQKKSKEEDKILFLGRIAPIKDLEILIQALSLLKDQKLSLELVGPPEEKYLQHLKQLVQQFNLEKRVKINPPIYDLKEKIKKIDSAKIFVLPSKREAMPQSLIEAMARGKLVIASSNPGTRDLIETEKNGFLFETGNAQALAQKIEQALHKEKKLSRVAQKSVRKFAWNHIHDKIEALIAVK